MYSEERALLKRIRIKTRRRLNTLFVGEYHSAFKGHGLLFDSVREYQYGDDVRDIDWNVSARMDHLYIKKYAEERELSIVLMIDLSASMGFGSSRSKRELVLETATLLLYLAQMNNDRVTVLLFTDRVEKYIAPGKGRRFILQVLSEIVKYTPVSRGTDISSAVDFLRQVQRKRSVIFVISDFLDEDFMLKLKLLRRRHDVIPVAVSDPLERGIRHYGLVEFVDLESGKTVLADVLPGADRMPAMNGLDAIRLSTDEPIETALLKFFEKRNRTQRPGGR